MTDVALGEWHGVMVDAEGRVTELKLGQHNLAGLHRVSFSSCLLCRRST
jgi:hypothetical protein